MYVVIILIAAAGMTACVVMGLYLRRADRNVAVQVEKNRQLREQLQDFRNMTDGLQDICESMEKSSRAKSVFLSRMSHDLRTPMNAIIGYSALLKRYSEDVSRVEHYADRIFLSGQTLLELIDDALDMNSVESGNVRIIEHDFSLISAFEEIKSAIRPQAAAKNQVFNFYMTGVTEKDFVKGDKQRLCQILRNLLSNASKYTPEGGCIDLIVNVIELNKESVQLLCQIKDTGCGMSRQFQEKVFLPFEREDNEMNTSIPGTGLGLYIARSFTELMNGSLTIESQQGAGTLVTVSVPLSAAEKRCGNMGISDAQMLTGLRFLVAEDNESNAEILAEVLKAMGAECVLTSHGQAAVEAFVNSEQGGFDMILMDIQMPVMNGYQAAAAIRKSRHPDAENIAIIAMTADAFEEDVQKAFVSGMDAHIAKPLELQTFLNTIKFIGKR